MLVVVLAGIAGATMLAPASERQVDAAEPTVSPTGERGADRSLRGAAAKGGAGPGLSNQLPGRDALGEAKADPFARRSWQLPPQAPVPRLVSPPSAPVPPAMVYRFAGRVVQDGKVQIFLSKGDTPIVARAGDVLDGGYVVQDITTGVIALIHPASGHRVDIVIPPVISTMRPASPANAATASTGLAASTVSPGSNQPVAPMLSAPATALPFNPASRLR